MAKSNGKWSNGAFVFFRASGLKPQDPEQAKQLALEYNVGEDVVPEYAGDRATVARAINSCTSGLSRKGWLVRPITKKNHSLVRYGIVREEKKEERLDHDFEALLEWSEEEQPEHVRGNHQVASLIDSQYQQLRGKIVPADWTATITNYLLNKCYCSAVRDDGRVYWCPPQHLSELKSLRDYLDKVGISLVLCEIEAEAREVVKEAASESLHDAVQDLVDEVDTFDGSQKPSTYAKRMDAAVELEHRATLYKEALGIAVDQLTDVIERSRRLCQDHFDERANIRITRSGKRVAL